MFKWGEEEDREFEEVKKKLETIIPISPADTKQPLIIHTDASNDGLGWILTQMRDQNSTMENCYKEQQVVLEMGSASLTDAQKRYAPIEQELLAVATACKKLDYFCRWVPNIYIYTDCAPLVALFQKDFTEITNSRILRLMEKLMSYNLEFHHIPGSHNKISNYISRIQVFQWYTVGG